LFHKPVAVINSSNGVMAVFGSRGHDWLPLRLWRFLEVPAHLPCRAVCSAWQIGVGRTETTTGCCLLSFPHLAAPTLEEWDAVLAWAIAIVSPTSLETLSIPLAPSSTVSMDTFVDECGPTGSSSVSSSTFASNMEGEAAAADKITRLLCWMANVGAADWVAWLLHSRRGLGTCGAGHPCVLQLCNPGSAGEASTPPSGQGAMFAALQTAAAKGHADVVGCLLSARADVRAVDDNDCTALHWSADHGHVEACRTLIEAGAPIDARDDDDWTPLCLAAEEGHVQVCELLLIARAHVDLPDEDLRSPLWWAVWKMHYNLVTLLLDHRANPLQADTDGVTPQSRYLTTCRSAARRMDSRLVLAQIAQ